MRYLLLGVLVAASAACGPKPSSHGPGPGGAPRVLTYAVVTMGRHAGEAEIRIEADGRRLGHFTFNDRGRGPDIRTELALDAAGLPHTFRATGLNYLKAPVDERLDDAGGTLSWQSTSEHGQAAAGSGWYVALNDALEGSGPLARALLRAKDHRVKLLPTGEAWIDDDTPREIEIAGARRQLHRIAVAGSGSSRS
jgi:hypothetical protein